MRFLKLRPAPVAAPTPSVSVRPSRQLEGWTEAELVFVYNAAPLRNFKQGDSLLADVMQTDSFFLVLDGSIEVIVKCDLHSGRPGIIRRGDCVAPLPKSDSLLYCAVALEPSTIIEITPAVLDRLPAQTQVRVYKTAITSTSKINAYVRGVNGEMTAKTALLGAYVAGRDARLRAASECEHVKTFIRNIPALPAHAMDLAVKLLQETTSVQEVVEAIKRDPATASLVLRTVNSAMYGFPKKIETFYHACMILGFNNIYTLVMREAVQSAMPLTPETHRIHAHSVLISTLCYETAKFCKNVTPQSAATAGLLHDMGQCVQAMMKHAHWMMNGHIEMLDSAQLGAELLRNWSLPERLCQIIEQQRLPEYTAPASIPAEYPHELSVLHVAHNLEGLLIGEPLPPESAIYTKEHMASLGLRKPTPEAFLKESIMPTLMKTVHRLPQETQKMITAGQGLGV
jgi:HD-like signal output (HDOD) protein